jgi:molybdopterin-guanine dinucleotide biosynthesis protein A
MPRLRIPDANSTLNSQHSTLITGVILAGGLGRVWAASDKGLKVLCGKPMVAWAIERFAPQVDEILINANQNLLTYGVSATA